MLHAWKLAFEHPFTGAPLRLLAPIPADMIAEGRCPGGRPEPLAAAGTEPPLWWSSPKEKWSRYVRSPIDWTGPIRSFSKERKAMYPRWARIVAAPWSSTTEDYSPRFYSSY